MPAGFVVAWQSGWQVMLVADGASELHVQKQMELHHVLVFAVVSALGQY